MEKSDLTNSSIDRQNIFNNRYAVNEIQIAAGIILTNEKR